MRLIINRDSSHYTESWSDVRFVTVRPERIAVTRFAEPAAVWRFHGSRLARRRLQDRLVPQLISHLSWRRRRRLWSLRRMLNDSRSLWSCLSCCYFQRLLSSNDFRMEERSVTELNKLVCFLIHAGLKKKKNNGTLRLPRKHCSTWPKHFTQISLCKD